jgi:hypothetical protein
MDIDATEPGRGSANAWNGRGRPNRTLSRILFSTARCRIVVGAAVGDLIHFRGTDIDTRAQSSRLAVFGGLGMSFSICRGTLGSLAMFTAIRNASSRVSSLALERAGVILEVHICQRLPVAILHDEAGVAFDDRPGRWEAALRGHRVILVMPISVAMAPELPAAAFGAVVHAGHRQLGAADVRQILCAITRATSLQIGGGSGRGGHKICSPSCSVRSATTSGAENVFRDHLMLSSASLR